MSKPIRIFVEYTITDPKIKLDGAMADEIKAAVEERLRNTELAKYLWSLGNYSDSEVFAVSCKKTVYDTRQ